MVVMINLSDTDDPYLIFESLNFKGSPLEQADLVRNYFLMRFPVTDQQAIYDQLWLPMQGRLGPGLTEFMRHFLGAEGEKVRKGDVYAAIERLVTASDSASVRILMTRMERLSSSSSETTLLVPLSALRSVLDLISVTKTEDRQYWHIVIQKKLGKFIIRLLGGKDGPDLTGFNIGSASQAAAPQ